MGVPGLTRMQVASHLQVSFSDLKLHRVSIIKLSPSSCKMATPPPNHHKIMFLLIICWGIISTLLLMFGKVKLEWTSIHNPNSTLIYQLTYQYFAILQHGSHHSYQIKLIPSSIVNQTPFFFETQEKGNRRRASARPSPSSSNPEFINGKTHAYYLPLTEDMC